MPTAESAERVVVHYTGRVQGVGFRYTTHRIVAGYAVTGYVRNLADGRVELVAEGKRSEIGRFLASIRRHFDGFIRDESCDRLPANGEFDEFAIRP